jgi:glycosyltransferase involved in cell wall biosynthesis
LINPSLSESFGMSLVEAMAHGVPVIATCVGGMVEIVEMSKGGILAEPDDPRALADAILQLLSDEELRRSMGAAGQQSIPKHFSWDKIAEDLSCLYSRLKVRL